MYLQCSITLLSLSAFTTRLRRRLKLLAIGDMRFEVVTHLALGVCENLDLAVRMTHVQRELFLDPGDVCRSACQRLGKALRYTVLDGAQVVIEVLELVGNDTGKTTFACAYIRCDLLVDLYIQHSYWPTGIDRACRLAACCSRLWRRVRPYMIRV